MPLDTLEQLVSNLDKTVSLMQLQQQNFIAATSTEFSGMCQRVDKLVTEIEKIEGSQILESRRTDEALRKIDNLYKSYDVNTSDTKRSVERINQRIDEVEKSMIGIQRNVSEIGFIVKIVTGTFTFIALTIGAWLAAQILGLIK